MAFAVALLLMSAAPAGIQLVTPEGSGPVSLAVIVVPSGGEYLHQLQFPPTPENPEGELDSLVEHRRTFVGRILAGPRTPARITIRQIYPEMPSMRRDPVRRLALLEHTDGGYWHVQWQMEVRGSHACLTAAVIAHFRISIPRRIPDRNGNICFNL
jgi:hypothetical protein